MKIQMIPSYHTMRSTQNGIARVVEAYGRHLTHRGHEIVGPNTSTYDIKAVHAGTAPDGDVAHTHGLYWTADYVGEPWEWKANKYVVMNIAVAHSITVPSEWVAETFRRDMRINPHIVPHGIDFDLWQDIDPMGDGYALWNKNRTGDVCDPAPVAFLAVEFEKERFISTFRPDGSPDNLQAIGVTPHIDMMRWVAGASVYLSTTKETFGIGTLEAMACGVPVLGFAHGGNNDIVQHGMTGYLAEPGNLEDLKQGFAYCLKYRKRLGDNGRELAKRWTWQTAVEKIEDIYKEAYELKTEPATVAIIIPTYNYADKVGRAIESAIGQEFKGLREIIVVDDGSTDNGATKKEVLKFNARDPRVRYIRQENSGVAVARNRGISESRTKYVCCLDADDAIDPRFLSVCVDTLEADRKIGIAFTGLRWTKPDGSTGMSQWPGPPDYNRQLERQNQIPTCCVFRRVMWERLGGYRQRYAPDGAGSEDAEFWTRAGAYGFAASLATEAGFFHYSWMSGRVSGAQDYNEPDWLAWHPWVTDEQHPFASVASPRRFSHPVRQYDAPLVSIVIPVGAGHEEMLIDALDSLEAQDFRNWEAIVVDDTGMSYENREFWDRIKKTYTYPLWLMTSKNMGAGYARNAGAARARAPFLLFLDADDWLYPQALTVMLEGWNSEGAIIYTDYVGKAHVDDPSELAEDLQQHIYQYKNGEAVIGYKAADYDPDLAQKQPEGERPYLWANVTCLIPRAWHQEIGGFDEQMQSWEDVDYHYRMARAGKCYARIPEELLVYRFSTGMRRQAGLQSYQSLVEYLKAKYQEIETVVCNCSGARVVHPNMQARQAMPVSGRLQQTANGGNVNMADDSMIMIKYKHPNRGQHTVVGPVTKIKYGFRAGGDTFLVHKDDIANNDHLYEPIASAEGASAAKAPVAAPPAAPPSPIAVEEEVETSAPPDVVSGPESAAPASKAVNIVGRLPGVTAPIAEQLDADGIETADQVLELGVNGLMKYKGIGAVKAETIIEAVTALQKVAAQA